MRRLEVGNIKEGDSKQAIVTKLLADAGIQEKRVVSVMEFSVTDGPRKTYSIIVWAKGPLPENKELTQPQDESNSDHPRKQQPAQVQTQDRVPPKPQGPDNELRDEVGE